MWVLAITVPHAPATVSNGTDPQGNNKRSSQSNPTAFQGPQHPTFFCSQASQHLILFLNYVPSPKNACWRPNPQCLGMQPHLEIRSLQRGSGKKGIIRIGPYPV